MEVVFTICLLIVPVLTVVALFLTLDNLRKVTALKKLVLNLSQTSSKPEVSQEAIREYLVNGM